MIEFELRKAVRDSLVEEEIDGVKNVVFYMTVTVGVKGNTYPSFLNSSNTVRVCCLKSMTGDDMDAKIQSECADFVLTTFLPIEN